MPTLHRTHLEPVVSLKEHLEMRLELHRQASIEQSKMLVDFNTERRQALERRLEVEVNHWNSSFDSYRQATVEYREGVERRVRQLEQAQANFAGRFAVIGGLGFVVTIAIEVVLRLIQ